MDRITIVGGGLAGCEAAWQLADRGASVRIVEMRPDSTTGAHRTGDLAEIVCSNSFKSTLPDTASGLLKREMDILGCRLLRVAHESRVPAGHALGIDRDVFARGVTDAVTRHPRITVERREVEDLGLTGPLVIATGPLTGEKLARALCEHSGDDHLYFYDAIAPSLDRDSIDPEAGFWASRYGKGDDDYLNIPIDRDTYRRMLAFIREAETAAPHAFEEERYFEACLPIEVLAARGDDTLRFGPMKPKGLVDPRTGREPYAAIQLRQESRGGSLLGMVGFQTRMAWGAQKEFVRSIPGLERAVVLRYGSIHRNMFLDIPRVCDRYLRDRSRGDLYYAGQICGVEGYVESIMSAIVVALSIFARERGVEMTPLPARTMIGALMDYVHTPAGRFQPMNANMGLVPYKGGVRGNRRARRTARNEAIAAAAVSAIEAWREANSELFPPPDFT
jgi:methylenetetrahydrofolate--tRNA-(uracil-5-)-methyltransferase